MTSSAPTTGSTTRSADPRLDLSIIASQFRPHVRTGAAAAAAVVGGTTVSALGPLVIGAGIDRGVVGGDRRWIAWSFAALVAISAVNAGTTVLETRLMGRLAQDYMQALRSRLLDHLFTLDPVSLGRQRTGRVVSRLTSDVQNLQQFLEGGMALLVKAGVMLAVTVAIMLLRAWQLALPVLACVLPLVAATTVYRRKVFAAEIEVRDRVANLLSHVNESLVGMQVVQAFAAEDRRHAAFRAANGATYRARMRTARATSLYYPIVELLPAVSLAVVLGLGATLVVRGDLGLGVVVAFALYANHLFNPIQQLTEVTPLLQAALASWAKILAFLDEEPLVKDAPDARPLEPGPGMVTFEGVTFRYGDDRPPALRDVDLAFVPGQRTVVVGESGAGKSTLARLLVRFLDPTEGRVLVDGQDLREVTGPSLRQSVTLVPQEGYLFDGTVAANIALAGNDGLPGAVQPDARSTDIVSTCRRLGILDRLEALPDGLDTRVDHGGTSLSAGQRQLVAIARAAVRDPQVVVLDEATANLDPATEVVVERALAALLADRTAIVIAHRVPTALRADRVVMLRNGRIVADGPPGKLLAGDGPFRRWVDAVPSA